MEKQIVQLKAYQTQDGKWHVDHPEDGVFDYSGANTEKNCKKVALAWNTHSQLVEALESLLERGFLETYSDTDETDCRFCGRSYTGHIFGPDEYECRCLNPECDYNKALAALAAAKGEQK